MFNQLARTRHRSSFLRSSPDLQSVTGDKLIVVGATDIHIDGLAHPVTVRVVSNLKEDLILGCDVLADSIINLKQGLLTMKGKTWPLLRSRPFGMGVSGSVLPTAGNTVFDAIIRENADIFSTKQTPTDTSVLPPMKIETTGPPICQPAYRTPLLKRSVINTCIDDMLAQGIIRHSVSPWASPVTLVPKKDSSTRFCIDYRKLNAVTVPDRYPIPLVQSILDDIGGSTVFTTLDLNSAYWQVPMDEESIPKTAFRCHRGLYEFLRLPFGLRNGPAAFQRIMDTVLGALIGSVCLVYLDDIVIYSANEIEHAQHIQLVFDRLRTAGLRLKSSKCQFGLKQIKLLGFIVTDKGIATDPAKIEVIQNLPPPTSVKAVRTFLGMTSYYRQFVPNYAQVSEPLTSLLRANVKFHWGREQDTAFLNLKCLLVSSSVMASPQVDKPYKLYTDACNYAVGGILVQDDANGVEKVIQYVSHALSTSQRKYATIKKEAYAVIYCINKLRPYLYGADFVVFTDHKPLKSLFTKEFQNTRIQRRAVLLAEYGCKIEYRKGTHNIRADMLSRIESPVTPTVGVIDCDDWVDPNAFPDQTYHETLPLEHDGLDLTQIGRDQVTEFPTELRLASTDDSDYTLINGVLYSIKRPSATAASYPRLVLPATYRDAVIDRAHLEVGHLAHATVTRLCEACVWPGLRRQVRDRLKRCPVCQTHVARADRVAMGEMPYANAHNQIISMDLIGPFVRSPQGCKYVLTIIDHCTLWAEAYPIPDKTNHSVWTAFSNEYLPRFGTPEVVTTDNGQEFCATVWEKYLKDLGVEHRRTTPAHPNSNGRSERFKATIKQILSTFVNNETYTWQDRLADALAAYRISVSSVTGYSPYFLLYGRQSRMPMTRTLKVPTDDYFGNRLDDLARALQMARQNTEQSRQYNRARLQARANAKQIKKGDFVIVIAEERLTFTTRWDPLWLVTRVRGTTLWLHQTQTGKTRRVHREKVRLADPSLAWDEVRPRPKRRQHTTPHSSGGQRVLTADDRPMTSDDGSPPPSAATRSRRPRVPPLRPLQRDDQWHSVTTQTSHRLRPLRLLRQHGHWQTATDGEEPPTRLLIRKRVLAPPTEVEQKRARREVISLVSAFSH